jgi:hypothetical protein
MTGGQSPAGKQKRLSISRWTAVDFVQFLVRVSPQHVDGVFRQPQPLNQCLAAFVCRHTLHRRRHTEIAFRLVAGDQAQQRCFHSGEMPISPRLLMRLEQFQLLTQLLPHRLDYTRQPPAFLRPAASSNGCRVVWSDFGGDIVQRFQRPQSLMC